MDMSINKKWLVSQFELFEKSRILVVVESFDTNSMHDFDFFQRTKISGFLFLNILKN
jgi:hypothetical protein